MVVWLPSQRECLATSSRDPVQWCATLLEQVFPSTICLQMHVSICYEAQIVLPVFNRKKNTLLGGHELMGKCPKLWKFHSQCKL